MGRGQILGCTNELPGLKREKIMKRSRFPRPLRSSMELAIVIALTLAWAPWVSPALATTPSSWINFDGDGKTDPAVWRPDKIGRAHV